MLRLPRFYPILDADSLARRDMDPLEAARGLLDAGAGIIQYRWKGAYTRVAYETAAALSRLVRGGGALFVINDRTDVAVLAEADGVHVGQDDLPPSAVRSIAGDGLFVGLSTHNEEQLRGAAVEPVDYVALGPVFGTTSKEKPDPELGLAELARLAPLSERPLVAIGGITLEEAPRVLAAGAAACAVISDWMRGDWRARARMWAEL